MDQGFVSAEIFSTGGGGRGRTQENKQKIKKDIFLSLTFLRKLVSQVSYW